MHSRNKLSFDGVWDRLNIDQTTKGLQIYIGMSFELYFDIFSIIS